MTEKVERTFTNRKETFLFNGYHVGNFCKVAKTLQTWNFFCTFTYSDEKHTEESFRKSLRNTLKHFVNRKGWKHIGVWERGGDTNRLHFHGIFYIPPNGMVGELIEIRDYSTKDNRMQTATQNTYFLERYGRNDFQKLILPHEIGDSLGYLKIAETLNLEGVSSPATYAYEKFGQKAKPDAVGLWSAITIREMLDKIIYIGHMPQLRWTSLSYKNHKRFRKNEEEWSVVYNTHEPIISQELWDKVHQRRKSVAQGRKTKVGYTHPLSGFLFCADCGNKMKLCTSRNRNGKRFLHFDCGYHVRYGKAYCFSHYIAASILDEIVLEDIREMARRVTLDEKAIREEFIRHNTELADNAVKSVKKELQAKRKRTEEISRLIQVAYEDRVKGKMPEDICLSFIQKYLDEQKKLETEIAELEAKLTETENTMQSADDFIRSIKKYFDAPELTREMCYELIDRIVVGSAPKTEGEDRVIDIIYKVDIASVLRYKLKK